MPWKDPEKRKEYRQRPEVKERRKKYRQEYRQRPEVKEKERIRKREYRQRPEVKEKTKNEMREYRQRPENLEKERIRDRKRYAENPEKRKRKYILWAEKNHEYLKSYWNIRSKKFPRSNTYKMTIYRRKHRHCEWYDCNETQIIHIHHILSKKKYPEFIDGDYHGGEMNNFISYCPLHHFAYHYAFATKRNDTKHKQSLKLLWGNLRIFADKKGIPMEDLEIELSQIVQ